MDPNPNSYVCDTIPPARLAPAPPDGHYHQIPPPVDEPDVVTFVDEPPESPPPKDHSPPPPPRKLCVRHQRMADEGTNLKLQQALDALPVEEREAVNAVWSNFSSSSHRRRGVILQGLLTMCCFSQLSLLTEQLAHLIRLDPFVVLPREVGLKILAYMDATSLCRAAQVSKRWKALADDNILWRGICEQHIGQKCPKCGWGLPVLEKKRGYRRSPCPSPVPPLPQASSSSQPIASTSSTSSSSKRPADHSPDLIAPPLKRQRSETSHLRSPSPQHDPEHSSNLLSMNQPAPESTQSVTRPWKDVYSERMTIERNWRRGRCTVKTLSGHTDGVMCLQFNENLSHPSFPVLITGSYDRTVRVWNLESGTELHCLKGHTRAVRALQFDEVKLITGSMDSTLKVWDWRRGKCIRTLSGHTDGVVCLNYDSSVLASGSVDSTIKVWNLRTGSAFTLRGHTDWVNAVQLWDSNSSSSPSSSSSSLSAAKSSGTTIFDVNGPTPPRSCAEIDPGKMLFSASDDGTIKLWNLNTRSCVRVFSGHVGQVQSMKLLVSEDCDEDDEDGDKDSSDDANALASGALPLIPKRTKPVLISGSLDNTIKLWDIETGKAVKTFFGHIEGVWAVASDRMRLVSASHDRTIKVWSREDGSCSATLIGHQAAVSCLALGEDKVVSGSDDWTVKVWSFSEST